MILKRRDSKNRCIKDGFWSSLDERKLVGDNLLTTRAHDVDPNPSRSWPPVSRQCVKVSLSLSLSPRRMREIAAGYTHARQSYAHRWRWRWWRFITSNGNSCSFIALPLSPSKEAHLWPSSRRRRGARDARKKRVRLIYRDSGFRTSTIGIFLRVSIRIYVAYTTSVFRINSSISFVQLCERARHYSRFFFPVSNFLFWFKSNDHSNWKISNN